MEAALAAIAQLRGGARAADLESDSVDFKEELGTVGPAGRRQALSAHHEPAARALAAEAACLANTTHGGALVVGVDDKGSGASAFVGSYLDTVWLRERIYALTQPHLAVDVIQEHQVDGKRLYVIDVAPALEEVRCDGKLRGRIGRECQELSGDQARHLLEARRRYDWSAEPSGLRLSQVVPDALDRARRWYREEHGRAPTGARALVTQLGLLVGAVDDHDPELNNAGALLLCETEPRDTQVDLQLKRVESAPSDRRVEERAPLLIALDRAWGLLEQAFPSTMTVIGVQRQPVQAVPQRAAREAIINALMHRDYRQMHNRVTVLIVGEPSHTLKIRSPGGFPPGVNPDRLLTTPSRPRNPVLANAFHVLGLAEREGIGIDTLYLELLRDGHPAPIIVEDTGDVLCVLQGGKPDVRVRTFFEEIAATDRDLGDDVRLYIAVTALFQEPVLRPELLAPRAQCTAAEALDALERLAAARPVERLVNGSRSFRLSAWARDQLKGRLAYRVRAGWEDHWRIIQAYLDVKSQIGRETAAQLLHLSPVQASRILSDLAHQRGLLSPVGQARGRGVRYQFAKKVSPSA